MKDLNLRVESTKLLQKITGENFNDTGFGNGFLDMTRKYKQQTKKKSRFHQNLNLLHIIRHYQVSEKAAHRMRENICKAQI